MFLTHADAQLYTVSFGSGPRTILALGGWVGSWELWTAPFTILSQSWRTVAFDHRGCGASIAPLDSITVPTMVADVLAVVDALGIEQCVLAAESAGVAIALQAALAHPDRFIGLICVAGLYHRPIPLAPDPFVASLRANYRAALAQFVDACVPEPDSTAVRHWGRQIVNRTEQEAAIRLYECMDGLDLRPFVSQIHQPTLILHGTADSIQPMQASQWLATQIPHNQLHLLPGAGHVPTITRPQDVVRSINEYFIEP
ncbi:MAG: alpha/beta hydrolase [Roseiflexaceae bacterium]|nr:alpha/beta hydrolase [Roseiflexaceae bacterium]